VLTVYIDPGYVKRSPNPKLVREYTGRLMCGKCMLTYDEKQTDNFYHCDICDRCCKGHDHHCGVLGVCIGKNNLWTFYLLVASFVLQTSFFYWSLNKSLMATTEECKTNSPKYTGWGVQYLISNFSIVLNGTNVAAAKDILNHGNQG
jgi:hypothetical protein